MNVTVAFHHAQSTNQEDEVFWARLASMSDLAVTGGRFAGCSPNPNILRTGGTTIGRTRPAPPISRLHVIIGSL